MAGVGALIGGGLQVASSIFGGVQASKAMKKVRKNLQERQKANKAWYDQRYNEDALQRADAQRVLAQTEESIRNRNRQSAGTQAVMGGTEASAAAAREANSTALSSTMASMAASAASRKDAVEQQYMKTRDSLDDSLNDLEIKKAGEIAKAVQGVADAGGKMANAF